MDRDPFDLVGDVLDGQFRVVEVAGEGSLSVVYKGHHVGVDAPVAIKCLNLPATLDAALVRPLVETFREASKLHYRLARGNLNIAQSLASGSTLAPRTGAVVPYLVREWFDGESLATDLAQRRAAAGKGRTVDEALALLEPAVDAVAYAHGQGVVHSALNPSNFFVARRASGGAGQVKVLDFGVARTINQIASELPPESRPPSAGLHLLFPAYAAPEQLDRTVGEVGPWTDVYALVLVLLEVLSDRVVMSGSETPALVERALDEHRRPTPRAHGLDLPRNLELVLTRAVARAPERRPSNAAALWRDVKASLRATGSRSTAAATLRPKALTLAGVAPAPAVAGAVPGRRLVVGAGSGVGTMPMSFEPPAASEASASNAAVAPSAPNPPVSTLGTPAPRMPPARPMATPPPPPQLAPLTPAPPRAETPALPPVIVAEPTPPLPLASDPPPSSLDGSGVDALLARVPQPAPASGTATLPAPAFAPAPSAIAVPSPVLAPDRPSWPTGPQAPTYPILEPDPAPPRRARAWPWSVAVGGLAALVLLAAGGLAWSHRRASAAPAESSSPVRPRAPSAVSAPGAAPPSLPAPAPDDAASAAPSPSRSPTPTAHFNPAAARRALDKTWHDLAHCKRGKLWGSGAATVTFGGDGTVSHVTLAAPFAGTPGGACVGAALSAAQVAPFAGKPGVFFYRFYVPPR